MERADQFIGQSLAFLDAVERASRAAPLNRPVLVIGERGTGKELIAERLHHLSQRWAGPLIIMNCAALPENLIEAELFGHEAGSFTGAAKTRHGRFEEADGGTLFLDELGTLSMPAQDRLLRAVEYGEITRIGASKPISVDVRIVAATNENLPAQVEAALYTRNSTQHPDRYLDPVSVASLIVSIATLAWTIYNDRKKQDPDPTAETIARAIRLELDHDGRINPTHYTQIINITANTTFEAIQDHDKDTDHG